MRAERKVIVLVPRKARQIEDDEKVNLAFVASAVSEHALELAPIGSLRAFAFFFEALQDFETFAAAVLFADSELCRQAEVFRLLLGTHADVNNRANHGSQISAHSAWASQTCSSALRIPEPTIDDAMVRIARHLGCRAARTRWCGVLSVEVEPDDSGGDLRKTS